MVLKNMPEKKVGKITHFFGNIGVAVINLESKLKVGDEIHITGHSADFTQKVESMQVDHKSIETANPGDDVGMKVDEKVKPGAEVFLTEEE